MIAFLNWWETKTSEEQVTLREKYFPGESVDEYDLGTIKHIHLQEMWKGKSALKKEQ